MYCNGMPLNHRLKEVINSIISQSELSRNEYFHPIDIDRVRIVSETHPTAKLYLKEGYNGITLDNLVILKDDMYIILRNWNKIPSDSLNEKEILAVQLIIHELVHVRQYRNMGKEVFINRYLAEDLIKGYPNIEMERQAYQFGNWAFKMMVEVECKNYVQDNIAWDDAGRHRRWQDSNLTALCRGTNSINSPGDCFNYVMRNGSHWGRRPSDIVNWGVALRLCAGTSDNQQTTNCFRNEIIRGQSLEQAINRCRTVR